MARPLRIDVASRAVNEEQTLARRIWRRARWEEMVRAVKQTEARTGDQWAERHGGLQLAEVVREAGMKYQAGAQGVKRFGRALVEDPERKRSVSELKRELSNI